MHFSLIQKLKSYSLQNFISGLIYQFVVAVCGLIMPRLIITNYGSVLNGLISTVTQMIAYLAIVEMGLASASLVALYEPMARCEYKAVGHVVASINFFYHKVALYFSIGTLCGGLLLPLFIADDIPVLTVWLVVAAVSGINLVTYLFLGKYRVLLQSDNRLFVSNYVRCIGAVLQFGFSVAIIFAGWNIAFIKFTAVLTGCIEALLLWQYCKKTYPEIDFHTSQADGVIKQRKDILVHQISALVLNNTDVLLLTLFGNTLALVSVYSVYNMVMVLLFNIIASFMSARSTIFAQMYVLNDIDNLRERIFRFEKWYFIIVFGLYTCMALLIMPFVRLYTSGVNDVNYDIPLVGLLFSILGICRVLRGSYSEITNAAGRFRETKIQAINSVWLNIAVSLILIWKYQIPGILIGSIIAELYRTVHCMFYFYRHVFKFNWLICCARIVMNAALFAILYILTVEFRETAFKNYYSAGTVMTITAVIVMIITVAVNMAWERVIKRFRRSLS